MADAPEQRLDNPNGAPPFIPTHHQHPSSSSSLAPHPPIAAASSRDTILATMTSRLASGAPASDGIDILSTQTDHETPDPVGATVRLPSNHNVHYSNVPPSSTPSTLAHSTYPHQSAISLQHASKDRHIPEGPQNSNFDKSRPSSARPFSQPPRTAETQGVPSTSMARDVPWPEMDTASQIPPPGEQGHAQSRVSSSAAMASIQFSPPRSFRGRFAGGGPGGQTPGWMASSFPESRFSEFEVVYDDGVRKQRTFSLTTEMDDELDLENPDEDFTLETSPLMDFGDSTHAGDYPPQAGVGLDATGVYGGLDYGTYGTIGSGGSPLAAAADGPHEPLLGYGGYPPDSINHSHRGGGTPWTCLVDALRPVWTPISKIELSVPQKRVLKASLAYLMGCLISFIPIFRPLVGASGHLAATSAVFFNPAKTLGRMVEAVFAGLSAIMFGFLVCIGSTMSAAWFNQYDRYILGHIVSVIVFGGGSTFIIAYAKAYFNRPTVNVACTLSHIMILVTLTKEGALSFNDINFSRVFAITTSMFIGVFISFVVCIVLWPESAHEKLRQDMGKSLSSFRILLKLLTKTFLLEDDMTPFGAESVQKSIESQVKSFSALAKSLEEAQLEFPGKDIKKYEDCVKSLNTLAQYLNGLRSSCGLQYDMMRKDVKQTEGNAQNQAQGSASKPPTGSGKKMPYGLSTRVSSFSLVGSMYSDDPTYSTELIEFLDHIGKPLKSLALTCKLTIEHLEDIFTCFENKKGILQSKSSVRQGNGHSSQQPHLATNGHDAGAFPANYNSIGARHSIRSPFGENSKKHPCLANMQVNLRKALDIFECANSKALKAFYRQYQRRSGAFKQTFHMAKHTGDLSNPEERAEHHHHSAGASGWAGEQSLEKAPVGEQIFLVYFFVFNLMEFSKELSHLVQCVESLVDGDEGLPYWVARNRRAWWKQLWFSISGLPRRLRAPPFVRSQASTDGGVPLSTVTTDTPLHETTPEGPDKGRSNSGRFGRPKNKPRLYPKPNMHNTKNTLHTPTPSSFYQRWSTRLWKFLLIFRSFQVKYAVKAAVATMILLIPAFVDLTRPYFVQYRGEWALISMLIVMVPTVGGTNIVGIYRIMGTLVGCLVGVVVYLLFPAHDIMLPICCLLFAIPNFYLVLISAYPRIGQVTLLAFNLVLLQTYNRRHGDGTLPPDDDDDDDDVKGNIPGAQKIVGLLGGTIVSDVWALALHRAVAVSLGVVCGVVVTSYVWPYEARVELRKGLSDLLLNISWLYNRLVSVYSTNLDRVSVIPQQERLDKSNSRLEKFLRRISFQGGTHEPTNQVPTEPGEINIEKMNKEFMAIELSLQLQLLELYALLAETPNEPRLKGKFPAGTYKMMLGSCQNILDRFLSMRLVITQDQWVESARRDFIIPVNKERREMVGNVLLYFYTIASALRLKTPLPPYLPPANHARMRLIKKIRLLPVVQNRAVMMDDNDDRYIFYYAYALVMDDVIRELERLGRWSQDLFGVITPAAEFEAWFTDDGQAPMTMPFEQLQSSATREAPMSPYRDVDEPYQYTDYHQQPISVASPSPSEPHVTYFASPEQHRSLSAGPTPRRQATESSPLLSGRHFDSEHDGKVSPINQDTLFYFDPLDTNADSNVNSSRHSGRDSMSIGTPVSTKSLNEYLRAPGSRLGRRVNSSQSLGPNRDLGVAQTWTERRPPNAPPPPRSYGSATQTRRHQSLAVRPSSSASVQSRNSTFVHTDTTGNVEGADARYPRDT